MSSVQDVYHIEERATTELSDIELTDEDVKALKSHNGITPLANGEIQVRQYIGTVGLPSGITLQIIGL